MRLCCKAVIKSGVMELGGFEAIKSAVEGRPSLSRLEKAGFRLVLRSTKLRLSLMFCWRREITAISPTAMVMKGGFFLRTCLALRPAQLKLD